MSGHISVWPVSALGKLDRGAYDMVVEPLSRNKQWRGLSPFFLGPVTLPRVSGEDARLTFSNMENAWQFSKVYPQLGHLADNSMNAPLSEEYLEWRTQGAASKAQRYPAGRGARPAFSVYGPLRLSYVSARKAMYVPMYAKLAMETDEFKELARNYRCGKSIVLLEFDAKVEQNTMPFDDIINDPRNKMGHSYVLRECLRNSKDPEWFRRIII